MFLSLAIEVVKLYKGRTHDVMELMCPRQKRHLNCALTARDQPFVFPGILSSVKLQWQATTSIQDANNRILVLFNLGLCSPIILTNVFGPVLQIFLYLEVIESNITSDWLNRMV